MSIPEISLTAEIQEAFKRGAEVTVRAEQKPDSQKWFGQLCMYRCKEEVGKAQFVILDETDALFATEDEALKSVHAAFCDYKNKTFYLQASTDCIESAKLVAAVDVRDKLKKLNKGIGMPQPDWLFSLLRSIRAKFAPNLPA